MKKDLINLRFSDTRYAQEKAGQRLHIVANMGGHTVSTSALCGKIVDNWLMTINVPMGNLCRNCGKAWNAGRRFEIAVYRTGKNKALKKRKGNDGGK